MRKIITSIFLILITLNAKAQKITGSWSSKVKISEEKTLEFNFHISKDSDNYITIIDIPTNRVTGLKPKTTIFKNDTLFINGSNLGIKYKGVVNWNTQKITGNFSEGGNTIPLSLEKLKEKPKAVARKPQP